WKPHGNAGIREFLFQRSCAGHAEMENARSQRGICAPASENIGKMRYCAGAARSDHRNADRLAHRSRQFAIEARAGTVRVHRSKQNFTRAALLRFACPLNDAASGRLAAAADEDL